MIKVYPCLFMSNTVICVVYVDDFLFWARSQSEIDNVINYFKEDGPSYNWLDQISHGSRGTTHLSDRFPYQGGDEGMPSGGLPRKGRDTDGDEGAFLAPACPGHRDHLGGGKTPTSKVITMRHAGPVEVQQWDT